MGRARGGPEMTEAGYGDRRGLRMTGGRAWRQERAEDDGRQGMEAGHGDRSWRQGTVIRKGLIIRRLAGGRCR